MLKIYFKIKYVKNILTYIDDDYQIKYCFETHQF